jgi:replication factor C subunit 3/5
MKSTSTSTSMSKSTQGISEILKTTTKADELLPWVEKYRPKNLDQIIDHSEKITVLRKMIDNKQLPHLLLFGLPGSGKTSIVLAAAREMYGDNYKNYIMELNASDHRGIDIVRTVIPEFVRVKSDKLRLIILDEVDAMTQDAQSALRCVMEKSVKNCRFCLICNNITKIIPVLGVRECVLVYLKAPKFAKKLIP